MDKKYRTHTQKDFVKPFNVVSFNWSTNNVEKHSHTFYEFFMVTQGEYTYIYNERTVSIKRGDFMMITPGDVHQFIAKPDTFAQHINFCTTPEKFIALCNALSISLFEKITEKEQNIISLQPNQIDFFINNATQMKIKPQTEDIVAQDLIINEMLFFAISTVYKALFMPQGDPPLWFKELLMQMHSPEFISMRAKDIYSLSHYSPATIIKFFKKYTGDTITSYFTKIKMQYACDALLNTDATTLSIASSLSYDSLSAFNHAFKAYTGMSPIEYKKAYKNNVTPPLRQI